MRFRHEFPVISVSHLKRSFKSGSGNITVLKDISLTVNRGEFVVVMGASGSGKSTLLNVLGGLLAPDSGTVTVDGMDLGSMSDASLTVYRRDRVGFIFQMFNLVGTLNVEENILLPSLAGGRKVIPSALDAMIEKVGLSHRRHAMPDTLSGGEQQRVAIAVHWSPVPLWCWRMSLRATWILKIPGLWRFVPGLHRRKVVLLSW